MYLSLSLLLGTIHLKTINCTFSPFYYLDTLFILLIKSIFLVEGIKLLLFLSVVVICWLCLLSPPSYPQLLLLLLSHTFTGSGFQHRPLSPSYTVFSLQLSECSFRWQGNCQLQKALSSLQTPKQHYPSSSACQEKDFTPPSALYLIRICSLLRSWL